MTTNNDKVNAARWRETMDILISHKEWLLGLDRVVRDIESQIDKIKKDMFPVIVPMKNEAFVDHQGNRVRIVDTEEIIRREILKDQSNVASSQQAEEKQPEGGTGAGREADTQEGQEAPIERKKAGRPKRNS